MARSIFTAVLAAIFFYVASPLLLPVLMGALFAILLMPLQERLERHKFPTGGAAALLTVGITLLLILPTTLSIYLAAKVGFQELQALKQTTGAHAGLGDWSQAIVGSPFVKSLIAKINEWYPIGAPELEGGLLDFIHGASLKLADLLGALLAHLPAMIMGLVVIAVSIYFLLVDGRRLVLFFRHNSMFSANQTDRLIDTLEATCRSVLLASLVSGAFQALFETVAVALLGFPNILLIGMVVFISSFIPLIGTGPITFGLALQQFLAGQSGNGIALLISAVLVTTMDNLIRPWFLRGTVNLHPLLAFVAAFGGLQTLGFIGVFLGPIIAALFVATLQILFEGRDQVGA